MSVRKWVWEAYFPGLLGLVCLGACSDDSSNDGEGSGGDGTGGRASGGEGSGGRASGGKGSGGEGSGGRASGGKGSEGDEGEGSGGRSRAGGANSGGAESGGNAGTGGDALGGEGGSMGECACFDEELIFMKTSPFIIYKEQVTFLDCGTFRLDRDYIQSETPDVHCETEMELCDGAVVAEDIAEALSHADVLDALESGSATFGKGNSHGTSFKIVVADREISILGPCEGAENCVDRPVGVEALLQLLNALSAEQQETEPCKSALEGSWSF